MGVKSGLSDIRTDMMFRLDHITVVASEIDNGLAYLYEQTGIVIPAGGTHPEMGTHNHLLRLGNDLFLEVIAISPQAAPPPQPRWYGLDQLKGGPPRLGTWVVRTDDLDGALARSPSALGRARRVTRGALSWRISVPDDGSLPFDGACPTLIEWPAGPHPAAHMPDFGCSLASLHVEHPEAAEIQAFLSGRFHDDRVSIDAGPQLRLTATIRTPGGLRTLG